MPVTAKTQSRSAAICHLDLNVLNVSSQSPSYDQVDTAPVSYTHFHSHYHYSSLKNPHASSSNLSVSTHRQAGFTLVEIMVVVVILSIFAGMMSLSVGGSESRKNRAFYEHLTDSLSYVRLLSAERMQPMGLSLQADKQGQVTPVIVTLSNPYVAYQTVPVTSATRDSTPKNAMELSADLTSMSGAVGDKPPTPSWNIEPEMSLPELPTGVSLSVQSLDAGNVSNTGQARAMQPWFSDQAVPQVLWFGTGQATPVTIEVRHNSRLVGEVITIMPDGSMSIGQGQ
ncbi:type II secretion system protein [Psychrobacter sp. AOP22-C1-22]|uniref:prepilin-type N-terminal cleavage/methylation domain-containing protein n=1 Tax=unclassified Psychrobacter TaxID=196806 RepID=UPI001788696B|nr:prepilin-type N-terminal cleavage/methylation domain-containing protein [Psychrobacter sp. FME6]MBE0405870.1 prepilin-type N-terminal cleavage/methylation domain-containing protein [Psychrobacter sp. FME6]